MRDKYKPPEDLHDKYGPTDPCRDDIYFAIQDEAMAKLIKSEVEPSSIELARYVIGRLGLDPRDLEPVEQLVALMLVDGMHKGPRLVAAWREKMARHDRAERDEYQS
jgi:hypothetical protein